MAEINLKFVKRLLVNLALLVLILGGAFSIFFAWYSYWLYQYRKILTFGGIGLLIIAVIITIYLNRQDSEKNQNFDIIKSAMETKSSISATYGRLSRELSPYKLGRIKGKPYCLFYQYGGYKFGGEGMYKQPKKDKGTWRLYRVRKLDNVKKNRDPLKEPHALPSDELDRLDEIEFEIQMLNYKSDSQKRGID